MATRIDHFRRIARFRMQCRQVVRNPARTIRIDRNSASDHRGPSGLNFTELPEPADPATDERPHPFRGSFGKRLRAYLALTFAISVLLGVVFHRPLFQENLAAVDARLVRSAQPAAHLADWIRDYRLASILNLRGGTPADPWYADEVNTAAANQIAFYDYPMLATRRPLRRDLLTLIDFLRAAPYPLLVHCKHGADRTGLAVALYRMVHLNEPPAEAMDAFSIFHGHIPIAGTQRLHEPLEEYARWLTDQSLPHSPDRFRSWVKDHYRSDDPLSDPRPLAAGPRPLTR
jgi:protein tyrosine phosphatase (PTP) superfamily phosphohydrolase (DUF442 family)